MGAARAKKAGKAAREVKVASLGEDRSRAQPSNALAEETASPLTKLFERQGALAPPYDPERLAWLFEQSSTLRQNVDAYATNVDGFGHHFEAVIDLEAADADQKVAAQIIAERARMRADPNAPPAVVSLAPAPTPEEVAARKVLLAEMMRAEKAQLEQFFAFCTEDMSFVALRRRARQDLEITGNGYWEVLRNGVGRIAEFVYLPATSMRLMPLDADTVDTRAPRKVSDMDYETVTKRRRFRRFVQVLENVVVYFKEFGDPRVISKKTGAVVPPGHVWAAGDGPATEVFHFRVPAARSPYGIPRWIGALLAVLGNRQAEEVNHAYFDNKSVPPLAVLVSGGVLTAKSVRAIEDHINTQIKGKSNFHKLLIIEAQSAAGGSLTGGDTSSTRVELKPLTDAQQKDALFLQYDERNTDKVGQTFRLPRLLRGDIRDFNRATAEAALEFAEQQVFGPEREDFDFLVNRKVLSDLRIRFWHFKSNAPSLKDPAALAQVISSLVLANVLTPEEARELTEGVFNRPLKTVRAPWVKQPVPLTLAGLAPVDEATGEPFDVPTLGAAEAPAEDVEAQKDAHRPLVTRTAMGYVTTVNEARRSHNLGPMTLADGTPDPRGELTIAEFLDKARGAGAAPLEADAAGDLSLADLQTPAGQLALAQGKQLGRRARRGRRGASLVEEAKRLMALRQTLADKEAEDAAHAFLRAKMRALREDGEVAVPDELVRRLVPLDVLKAPHEP